MGLHEFHILNPSSHLPPHTTPLGHHSAQALSTLSHACNTAKLIAPKPSPDHVTPLLKSQVGAGSRMGNTCTPMADSCQYMAKTTTIL